MHFSFGEKLMVTRTSSYIFEIFLGIATVVNLGVSIVEFAATTCIC